MFLVSLSSYFTLNIFRIVSRVQTYKQTRMHAILEKVTIYRIENYVIMYRTPIYQPLKDGAAIEQQYLEIRALTVYEIRLHLRVPISIVNCAYYNSSGYTHLSDTDAPIIPTNSKAPNIPTVFWLGSNISDSKKGP